MSLDQTYANKKVVIFGHTGFKGSWLSLWLKKLGAYVVGMSVDAPTHPSNYDVSELGKQIDEDIWLDIRDYEKLQIELSRVQPDYIFHLAAQAIVKTSFTNPIDTFYSNAIGTANILNVIRTLEKPTICVLITSDKVYENVNWIWGYRENDMLGGVDPYSASKSMAEIAISSLLRSFPDDYKKHKVGIARAGNVIGGGDWASDRIVPDCMRAWSENKVVMIRNPKSTRPWQHVLEPLGGYLLLASRMLRSNKLHGEAFNFGPHQVQNKNVGELIDEMSKHWRQVKWRDASEGSQADYEAKLLKLNCDKAQALLGWRPSLGFDETVEMTVSWYKNYYSGQSSVSFGMGQINTYQSLFSSNIEL